MDTTPLELAITFGHEEIVKLLLDAGADPKKPDDRGETPLEHAIFLDQADIVELLLSAGADPNYHTRGSPPLFSAIPNNDGAVIAALLAYGADPNARGQDGRSPLRYANQFERKEVVEMLVQAGAKE